MIHMMLSEAVQMITGAEVIGSDTAFVGCSTDSRHIVQDQLFIALAGDRFDGHDFIASAVARGASCALSERVPIADTPTIKVKDTYQAIAQLAYGWRKQFTMPLIAITGSNGKTTVKEMLSSILSQQGTVLATAGNLNNDIGVPLTLFNLGKEHAYAVVEMGANHPGEIARLAAIGCPDVAVITQCAPAHLAGFGSVAGVARAKAEIYSGLGEQGIAIINADDPYADLWRDCAAGIRQITFAIDKEADISATDISSDYINQTTCFDLLTRTESIDIHLPLLGRHNVMNALAAAACAHAVDIASRQIQQGLQATKRPAARMQFKKGHNGSSMIDDTYSANPASVHAALQVLRQYDGRRWLVLGDMKELGEQAQALHADCGHRIRNAGIDRLFTLGELSHHTSQAFGDGAIHFDSYTRLTDYLLAHLAADVTLLIKGSRAMQMEQVVAAVAEAN